MGHNLLVLGISIAVLSAGGLCKGEKPASDDWSSPLGMTQSHRLFLSRLARRTMRDVILGRPLHEPGYVPAALRSTDAEAVVRVRVGGFLLAETSSGPAAVAKAVRDAAQRVAELLAQQRDGIDASRLSQMLIEIELVGPATPIELEGDWTKPRAIDPFVEPGIHGISIIGPQVQARFCPSEVFTSDLVVADALQRIAQNILADLSQVSQTHLFRFRTDHWYQPTSGADVVSLRRGLTLVKPEAVSRQGLDAAIERMAAYLRYRQLPSGLFSYQYEVGRDRYSADDNVVRQLGAAYALARHAKWSGSTDSRARADRAIRFHDKGVRAVSGVEKASFVETADDSNPLGATALLALTMAVHPGAAAYEDVRHRLIGGMLWLQRPSGMFITAFPPAARVNAQDYFPGEALFALATDYATHPTSDVQEAFDRAIRFYRSYFHKLPSPALMPWQVQAYALMAQQTKRDDYAAYAFELADYLAAKQLSPANCQWSDLYGGIAGYEPGRVGISTASYLEGFANALTLARSVGDSIRAARYEQTVRRAARFVMQLEVRPAEAYFARSPRDAIGGLRATPSLDLLRIDHVQHALVALMKTRQVLFGPPYR